MTSGTVNQEMARTAPRTQTSEIPCFTYPCPEDRWPPLHRAAAPIHLKRPRSRASHSADITGFSEHFYLVTKVTAFCDRRRYSATEALLQGDPGSLPESSELPMPSR